MYAINIMLVVDTNLFSKSLFCKLNIHFILWENVLMQEVVLGPPTRKKNIFSMTGDSLPCLPLRSLQFCHCSSIENITNNQQVCIYEKKKIKFKFFCF